MHASLTHLSLIVIVLRNVVQSPARNSTTHLVVAAAGDLGLFLVVELRLHVQVVLPDPSTIAAMTNGNLIPQLKGLAFFNHAASVFIIPVDAVTVPLVASLAAAANDLLDICASELPDFM